MVETKVTFPVVAVFVVVAELVYKRECRGVVGIVEIQYCLFVAVKPICVCADARACKVIACLKQVFHAVYKLDIVVAVVEELEILVDVFYCTLGFLKTFGGSSVGKQGIVIERIVKIYIGIF